MKKIIKLENFKINNLSTITGGHVAYWNSNTDTSASYPAGDNIDWTDTWEECEVQAVTSQDGIGGGHCGIYKDIKFDTYEELRVNKRML